MPTGHSVNYFINVNRDRRHLLFCQCYKSHHQQLREYKFVWDKWTMIYMINKIRNDLPAICQISWYTLGNLLKSCLLKSKCYTGIYSSNSVNSLKINLFTLRRLTEFFPDPHCSLWQKTGVAISHSYPSYQQPMAFSSTWLTWNFFFTFSAWWFLPCLEIQQYKKAQWDAEINKFKWYSQFLILFYTEGWADHCHFRLYPGS